MDQIPGIDASVGTAGLKTGRSNEAGRSNGTAGPEEIERLKALSAQFEALLLGQMLREMRSSMFEDGDESGFGGGPLADAMYGELSLALGQAGGFGLAEAMRGALSRQMEIPEVRDSAVSEIGVTPAALPLQAPGPVNPLIKGYEGVADYRRAGIGFGDTAVGSQKNED